MLGLSLLSPLLLARAHDVSSWFRNWHFPAMQPLLALIAGVLILVRPKLLNQIVAIYLILIGLIGVFNLRW